MIHKLRPDGHFVPLCVDAMEAWYAGITVHAHGRRWQVTRDDNEVTCAQCVELLADTVVAAFEDKIHMTSNGREVLCGVVDAGLRKTHIVRHATCAVCRERA